MLRSIKYGVNGAVLAGLIAAPVAWSSVDKTVHLVVDGQARTVHTTAERVGQLLAARGYRVTSHDLVAPAPSSRVADGARIVLRRGRLLDLEVDGRRTAVWTTARTVNSALGELGFPTADFVSVSRSRRLSLAPTSIAIRTPQLVSVVHDGRHQQVSTTDATVGQVLADLNVTVSGNDRLSAALTSALHTGQTIRVQRVTQRLMTSTAAVPYRTVKIKDAAQFTGVTTVVHGGRSGRARITYAFVYVDGVLDGHSEISRVTLRAVRNEIVRVGTKDLLADGGVGASPAMAKLIARQLLARRGWGSAAQYGCLVAMWTHESGWRVHASNGGSGAYGIPQSLPGGKMASAGPNWQNSAVTQITWGLNYIAARYHDPCTAWATWQAHGGWY